MGLWQPKSYPSKWLILLYNYAHLVIQKCDTVGNAEVICMSSSINNYWVKYMSPFAGNNPMNRPWKCTQPESSASCVTMHPARHRVCVYT